MIKQKNIFLFYFNIVFIILFSVNVKAQVKITFYATGATNCVNADNAQWVAQSFQVAANYTMTKAVLEIENNGGTADLLTVELRDDNSGSPGSILASTTISTAYNTCDLSAPWVDANLSYCLQSGVTYYIVAHNTEAAGAGYGCIGNLTTPGYTSGQEFISTNQGVSWIAQAADLYFEVWGIAGCGPDAPIIHNTGGTDQLAFNNSYIFDASPVFRVSATHSEAFDGFQVEINTSSSFDGSDYTQEFLSVDAYSSGTQYNVECNSLSPAFSPSNGTTYYVRVRASSNNGSSWGDWSSETHSFTYKSSGNTDWHQTTEEQFDTDNLSSTEATATDDIRLGGEPGAPNDYDYSTGAETNKWCYFTIMANGASFATSSFIQAPGTETDIGTASYPTIATNNDNYVFLTQKVPVVFHYKYTITEAEADVTQITVFERLYSESATSHTLYIWNSTTSTWESLASSTLSALHNMSGSKTTNLTNYIDGSSQINVCIFRADPGNTVRQFGPDYPKISVTAVVAATSGTITSSVIDYASFLNATSWDKVLWMDNEIIGDIKYQVYYDNSGTPTIIPDVDLATNSTGFDTSPIDISGLNTGTYNKLYLFATLTDDGGTPILYDWSVTCNYSLCSAPTINAKADAADSKTICTGSSVSLTGGDGGDGSDCGGSWEYGWYTGDGTGSTWYDGTDWNNSEAYSTGWEDPGSVSPTATTTYTIKVRCNAEITCNHSDAVTVTVNQNPTTADAGSLQTICSLPGNVTMNGNEPVTGTGTWTRISGPNTPNIVNANLYNTQIGTTTAMVEGTYVYRWTISNGVCSDSWDEVTINVDAAPSTADAGSTQNLCPTTTTTLEGNNPTVGTGTWTWISGPNTPNIVNANLYNTQLGTTTAMVAGTYVYRWTISNGVCSNSWNEVTITVFPVFNAGTITGGGGTIPFNGDPGVMTANPSGGAGTYNYQWYYLEGADCPDIGGATLIGGATNQTYDPPSGLTTTTSYQCQVDATGTPDCANFTWTTNCVTVTVGIPLYGLYIQNNYLYNSAGSYIYVDGDTYGDLTIDGELKNFGTIKLESDWTNNNVHAADPASLVEFIGTAKQNVKSGGDDFAKVNIENTVTPSATDGIVLKDDMIISVTLALTDGIIITGSYKVIISDEAAGNITSPDYLQSWIFGHISRAIDATDGSGTYDFPVGTSVNPNLAQLIANSLDGISNLECYFKITPTTPNLNFAADLLEDGKKYIEVEEEGVWEFKPTGAIIDGSYDLKLYFNGFSGLTDELFSIISRPSDLDDGTNWELCSGSFSATDVADGYTYRTGCNTFCEKGISKAEISLPIELLYFIAKCDNDHVLLNWATASETNNDYFTLYKSADSEIFEPFDVISGAGNSNHILKYSAIDDNPYSGISYYRIKQTDFDGKYTYFKIIPVECIVSLTNDITFTVYPIPVNNGNNLFVKMDGIAPQKEVLIVVMDILGKEYYSKEIFSDINGSLLETMDMHNKLPPGVYIVTATINSIVYKKMVVVK